MGSGISGIVLAAGTSSRLELEPPKQVLELDGRPVLRWVVEAALGSRLAEVVVVLGHASERVAVALEELGVPGRLVLAENPDYRRGQSTSVRAGLARIAAGADAAVFMPADQPLVSPRLIDRLIEAHRAGGEIVVPTHDGRRGAPVLFDRAFFAELKGLKGDTGGRKLLPRHPGRIVEVEVDDPLELADVDTADDLRRLGQVISKAQ